MTPSNNVRKTLLWAAVLAGLAGQHSLFAQQAAQKPSATTPSDEETISLSPFTVTTEKDQGYKATNATSGTRLNTAIKELPMPIEVITEEFLRDTGSSDLRQSLRYSSGILLQTQNDYASGAGSFSVTPGKVNNPEGLTASPDMTHMKIRGFESESVLRDGFRRQNSTDSVNIGRVEIARGPSSLLYGVGNFGGVVNYLVKMPEVKRSTEISAVYGSYNFIRGTIDTTGKITEDGKLAYRVTAAAQRQDDFTDFNKEKHTFISPVITWKPFEGTEVLLDVEYGKQRVDGIGWQNLRAAVSSFVNDSSGYNGSFLQIPGMDVRTMRWSGPDTYRDSTATNVEFKVTQRLAENLHLMAGVNHNTFKFTQMDNLAALTRVADGSNVPAWAIAPVTYQGLSSGQANVPAGPQPSTIAYQWHQDKQDNTHDQARVELNYKLDLFHNSNRWLQQTHSFLAGFNYTKEKTEDHSIQTPGDVVNYHSPTDYKAFRFGKQGDGSADRKMVEWDNQRTTTSNPATYGVYQGKLLDNRLTLVAGVRRDRSWNRIWMYNPEYNNDGTAHGDKAPSTNNSPTNKDTTYQYGVNFAITRELSVYAMHSEGIQPNYQGKLDLYGNPLQAALAKDNEAGVKVDLWNGKISGTFSVFEITRSRAQVGSSSLVWFAPIASGTLHFNPNKDIVYNINDLNPYNNGWNAAVVDSKAQWDAGVASGAIYQATNNQGATNWYVNASKASGATFMDAIFANVAKEKQYGWWGWIYGGADPGSLPFDNLVNNATMDDNGTQKSVATGTDRSKGWDTQLIFSPTENLQVLFSWSHINKVVINAQAWAKYPYPQDRWAIWYAPISWSATAGRPLNEVYTDPSDTSTFIAFGNGLAMDDTPKDHGTAWVNYQFPKHTALKNLSLGLGGSYESNRTIYPAYGQNALDNQGNSITLITPKRYQLNAMVKYGFQLQGHDSSVQLNVDNVLNDRKLYGWIYASPLRWQVTFNYKL